MKDEALLRYARHILLDTWGEPAQERLAASHCLVVGAGGLGASAILFLASAGVGRITVVDDDVLETSNLQRQVLYRESDLGLFKADAAAQHIQALNPYCEARAAVQRVDAQNIAAYLQNVDVVLDCSDNFTTRHIINAACVQARRALVSASALQWQGQLVSFDFRDAARDAHSNEASKACYACIFPSEQQPTEAHCATYGVFAPLVGMMGSMQAGEALKLLSDSAKVEHGRLQLFDAQSNVWTVMHSTRHPQCPVCARSTSRED